MRGSSLHPASHCGVKVRLLKHLVCAWEGLMFWLITEKVSGSCVILLDLHWIFKIINQDLDLS